MSIPTSQISDENLPDENPGIVEEKQCEGKQNPPLDSQFPKILTLDDHDPEKLAETDVNSHQVARNPGNPQDSLMEDQTDPQNVDDPDAISAPSPRYADINVATSTATSRRGPKRKKIGPKRSAQEKKSREKFQVLIETLKPIPFVTAKALDFSNHETLLKRLGLWDFVHIEFDRSIRSDLLAQLIASYTPGSRCSYVNGIRIMINRADLGRALKLPVKKTTVTEDVVMETLDLAESIAFIEELVSNWMLLHEDTYIMPAEVLSYTKLIKEGNLDKVDWAGLIWCMVDKELKASQLVDCYYASHLQQLIKSQHEELLGEEPKVEVEVKDEEEEEEEEEDGSGDVKMGGVDDGQVHELEEHNIELSLGQDSVEKVEVEKEQVGGDHIMDFEDSKEEEPGQWLFDRKNNMGEPLLRQCDIGDLKGLDCGQKQDEEIEQQEGGEEEEEEEEDDDDDEEEEEAEDMHEGGFRLSPKCISLEGMSSGSLIQAMDASLMPFSSGIELRDNSLGDFLSPREDAQMISGASLFGNGHKRDMGQDNHNSHHSLNGSNKRLRSDNPWDAKPVDFEMCVEQMENWMGKARLMYAAKEQTCEESSMNQQLLLNELQKRDNMIEHLHKSKVEDNQKRQMEVYRLEKELFMMANLLEGYRKALKDTQKAFAEYRAHCPQAEEPLYKDVPGSGGLVLSVMELEKERLKQEEEDRVKRLVIEKKLKEFEGGWICKLEDHLNGIQSLNNKLLAMEEEVKLLNEVNAKHKVSDPPKCSPSEGLTA